MKQAIIKTLCYSQIFGFPLTLQEIHQRLIGKKATILQIENSLKQLKIKKLQEYYYLSTKSLINNRLKKNKISEKKIKKAYKLARILKIFPSINAIYLTGGLAVGNANNFDDIDFFIITKQNTLWTTRFLTVLLLNTLGVRRKPKDNNINNKICLNMWISENALKIENKRQSLYTAYEIIQAKPIWYKNKIHQRFLYQNRWIQKHLPNTVIPKKIKNIITQKPNKLEMFLYHLQKQYMKKKITREKISPYQAFFHPRDTLSLIENKHQRLFKRYYP